MTVSDGWDFFKEKCLETKNKHTYRISSNSRTKLMWLNNHSIEASKKISKEKIY